MIELHSTTVACSDEPGPLVRPVEARASGGISYLFVAFVIFGVILRIGVAALPGSAARTAWGGGGDTAAYLLLAQNLAEGRGYGYAGMPTALRAPVYPLLLASFVKLFGAHALEAIRWLQFLEGMAVAFLCAALTQKIFGGKAWKPTFVVALFLPTLVAMNGEILTEATATLFVSAFLFLLAEYFVRPRWLVLAGLACIAGLGALVRFNMALLAFVLLGLVLFRRDGVTKWQGTVAAVLLPLLIVSPWLIRNFIVFHGEALFSTHSGLDALEGVVTPQGRALPGDAAKLRAEVGWVPPTDVESSGARRQALPEEPVLDRQCWKAAENIRVRLRWRLIPLELKKLSAFWLSTDQLIWTGSFSARTRVERFGGVILYWLTLALALIGWFQLRSRNMPLARIFAFYAALVTVAHLPFVMNTRLRMPFIDPLLAVLAGIGILTLLSGGTAASEMTLANHVPGVKIVAASHHMDLP